MRRILSLLAAVIAAMTMTAVFTGSASALGGESLGCRVLPSNVATFTAGSCHAAFPYSGGYVVQFQVLNASPGIGISWSVPAGYRPTGGCSTNATGCEFSVSSFTDNFISVSATLTQGGASETVGATASTPAVCGRTFC